MQQKLQFRGAVFTLDQHRLPCQELNNSITFFFFFLPKSKPLRNISSACWMWHHCAGMFPSLLSSTSVGAWVSLQVVSASCWVGQMPWLWDLTRYLPKVTLQWNHLWAGSTGHAAYTHAGWDHGKNLNEINKTTCGIKKYKIYGHENLWALAYFVFEDTQCLQNPMNDKQQTNQGTTSICNWKYNWNPCKQQYLTWVSLFMVQVSCTVTNKGFFPSWGCVYFKLAYTQAEVCVCYSKTSKLHPLWKCWEALHHGSPGCSNCNAENPLSIMW